MENYNDSTSERAGVRQEDVIGELAEIGFAPVSGEIKTGDKLAALEKLAKITGLYESKNENISEQTVKDFLNDIAAGAGIAEH